VDTTALLKHAIQQKLVVVATYNGLVRQFCPHALGTKRDRRHVLAFQFAGSSRRGLHAAGSWRCFEVDRLQDVSTQPGPWRSAPSVFNPQSCLDTIEVAVQPFPPLVAASTEHARAVSGESRPPRVNRASGAPTAASKE